MVGHLGKLAIDSLFRTTRIESIGYEPIKSLLESRQFIAAIWHSRILIFSYLHKGFDAVALVSRSKDGEYTSRILQEQGFETVRGSSSKGGLRALAFLIKRLKHTRKAAVIIPDGPRGPRFKVQPGIIALAQKTGYPVLPMSYSAKHLKILSSWDRFIIPLPFTRCRVIYGKPMYFPENTEKQAIEFYRLHVENELNRITKDADRYYGHLID